MTQEHTADLKQRIEAQFSDLHQFLYQEEKLLQVKLKTEERRELIRLDEHKALLCVEISRLQGALHEVEEQLREQDPFALLRVGTTLPCPLVMSRLCLVISSVTALRGLLTNTHPLSISLTVPGGLRCHGYRTV